MRMFSLAASLCVVCSAFASESQVTPDEIAQWKKVAPSVVLVYQGTLVRGAAALIDADGWFLAHRSILGAPYVKARTSTGKIIQLHVVATDDGTQLALLQADHWTADMGRPVKLSSTPVRNNDLLFAVIPSGVIRAQYVSGDRIGVMGPSHRLVPLAEIRFEAPAERVGGALVFTAAGELVGAMQATLGGRDLRGGGQGAITLNQNAGGGPGGMGGSGGLGGGFGGRSDQDGSVGASTTNSAVADKTGGRTKSPERNAFVQQFSPSILTVGFVVGKEALDHVVRSFLTPTHEVSTPTLGIICREAPGTGALIEGVNPGSPADIGGLRFNDILVELAGHKIHNQVDFAKAMLLQEVGKAIQLTILRDQKYIFVTVVVGSGTTKLTPSP